MVAAPEDRMLAMFPQFPFGEEAAGIIVAYTGDGWQHLVESVGIWLPDHMLEPPPRARGPWLWEGEIMSAMDETDIVPLFDGAWRQPGTPEILSYAAGRLWA